MKKLTLFLGLILLSVGMIVCGEDFQRERLPLKRNGHELFLQSVRGDKSSPKKNILMVHGMTYASHYFDLPYQDYSLMEFFARNGYTAWRLDITGFGQSESVEDGFLPASDYAAEDIDAAVRAIARQAEVNKIDLFGWSWGTVTSSKYAVKHPEAVDKLVLYAPIVTGILEKAASVTEAFVHDAWKSAMDDFQLDRDHNLIEAITDPGLVAAYQKSSREHDKEWIPNASRREVMSSRDHVLIPLEKLKMPVLIIYGSRDPYLNFARILEGFPALLPSSELVVINGGAHAVFLEKPFYRKFRQKVLLFLEP